MTFSRMLPIIAVAGATLLLSASAFAHPGVPGHRHVIAVAKPLVSVKPASRARAGTTKCALKGCESETTLMGPNDNTITRSGSASCDDGTCTRSGSVTGPNDGAKDFGHSVSR